METLTLGSLPIPASRIVVGLMRIADLPDSEIRNLVTGAMDLGVTMFDHADIYGGERHKCEDRFGQAMGWSSSQRDKVIIQSKTGIRPGFFDFSYDHIMASVDESLKALRTDYLDILLLHRPDTLVEPEEVARAFDQLEKAGKVKAFGVSNHTPAQIRLLKTAVTQDLVADQVQAGLGHAALFAHGIAANMESEAQSASRDLGLLEYSRLNGITLQAWSPMQSAHGPVVGNSDHYAELNQQLKDLGEKYSVSPSSIALAWLLRHPAKLQVVLGTTKLDRVKEAADAVGVTLTRQEWYSLFTAAGYRVP